MSKIDTAEITFVSKPPMNSFPLSPELRDLVYEQLLDARYTRLKRRTGQDPAYKLHTNVLRVNHTIHKEAERLLYERNTFVNAYHSMDDTDRLMSVLQLWVPLVTRNYTTVNGKRVHRATTMKHVSLQARRLNLSYGVQYGHSSLTGHSRVLQNRSCIFLAADLESHCSLLSDYLVNIEGPKVVDIRPLLSTDSARLLCYYLSEAWLVLVCAFQSWGMLPTTYKWKLSRNK